MKRHSVRWIGLALIVFLTVLAPVVYWIGQSHLGTEAAMQATYWTVDRVERLEDWLMNREIRFREFSHFFDYDDFEKTAVQRTMNPYLRRLSSQFYKTYFADTEGVFYSSDSWIPSPDYDPRERNWYQKAVEVGSVVYVSPYIDADTMEYVVSFVVPVYRGRQLMGVLGVDLPTYAIDTLLIDTDASYLMTDEAGFVMASPLPGAKQEALSEQLPQAIIHVLDGQPVYYDRPTRQFYLRQGIADTGWSLYAVIESARLNTDYATDRRVLMIGIVLVYLLLVMGIWKVMREALLAIGAHATCSQRVARLSAERDKEGLNKQNADAFLLRLADDLDTQRSQFSRLVDEEPLDRDRFNEMFELLGDRITLLRELPEKDLERVPEFNRRCILRNVADDLKKWLLLNYHLREDQIDNAIAPDVVAILDDYLVRRFFLHFTQRLFIEGSVESIRMQMEHHMIKFHFALAGSPKALAEETSYEESLGVSIIYEEATHTIDVRIPVLYQDWKALETEGEVDEEQKRSLDDRVTLITDDPQTALLLESIFRRLQIHLHWSEEPREQDEILLVDESMAGEWIHEPGGKFVIMLRDQEGRRSDELVLTKPYTFQKVVDLLSLYKQAKTLEESE